MTDEEYTKIGKMCRDAKDGNLYIGSLAAELVGESYPFSTAMAAIVFRNFTDIELGKKLEAWYKQK